MALASHSVKDDGGSIICNHHIAGDNIVEEKCSLVSGRILKSRDNLRNQTDSNVTKVLDKDVSVAMNIRKRGNGNMEKKRGRGPSKAKDPNAPRRPVTPFVLYCKDERPKVRRELKNFKNGPEMVKELAMRWKRLEEKVREGYKEKAAAERRTYNQAMLEYKPSQEFLRRKAESNLKRKYHFLQTNSSKYLKKRGRGKGAPFLLYCKDERPKVRKEFKNWTDSAVTRELAQRWDGLDQVVRATYKERVKTECNQEYNKKSDKVTQFQELSNESESSHCSKYDSRGDCYRQAGKTTEYFLYLLSNWITVSISNPGMNGSQVQSFLWRMWSRMQEEETDQQSSEMKPGNVGLQKDEEIERRGKKVCDGLSQSRIEDWVDMRTNIDMKSVSQDDKLYPGYRKCVPSVSNTGDMDGAISEVKVEDITQDSDDDIIGMEDDTSVCVSPNSDKDDIQDTLVVHKENETTSEEKEQCVSVDVERNKEELMEAVCETSCVTCSDTNQTMVCVQPTDCVNGIEMEPSDVISTHQDYCESRDETTTTSSYNLLGDDSNSSLSIESLSSYS